MKLTEMFLYDLEREAAASRRVLARVPEGRDDWKPHPKSMPLGYLAALVARMPGWLAMMINLDSLDFTSPSNYKPTVQTTNRDLLQLHDKSVTEGRQALTATTDDHLLTNWRLFAHGNLVDEKPRHQMIRDAVFSHLSHHRGQLTVYLRLNEATVPGIFGPSADEPM
jgi:uncharacterized damage-inducible protein DinB